MDADERVNPRLNPVERFVLALMEASSGLGPAEPPPVTDEPAEAEFRR